MNQQNIRKTALYILLLLVTAGTHSCKKSLDEQLDVTPHDRLTDASVWSSTSTADVFLNSVYGYLPDGNNQYDPFDNWSDNSICGFGWVVSRTEAQQSNYTPATLNFDQLPYTWTTLYSDIRACNVFIKNVSASALDEDYKKKRVAEARFLRAYFYQSLWMTYGGVPVITEPLDVSVQGDSIFKARSTFDETYTFITTELAAVADDLPVTADESGRATKGAALTLKGWVELFDHQWAASAATNQQVMDLGVYSLFPDFGNLFMPGNNVNNEGIFFREYVPRVFGGRCD